MSGRLCESNWKRTQLARSTWAESRKKLAQMKVSRGFGKTGNRPAGQAPDMARIARNIKCFNCRKKGHMSQDCREPRRQRDKNGGKPNAPGGARKGGSDRKKNDDGKGRRKRGG